MSLFEVFKDNLQLAKEGAQSAKEFAEAKVGVARTEAEIAREFMLLGSQVYKLHAEKKLAGEEYNEALARLDELHKQLRFHQAKDEARGTGDEVVNQEIPPGRLDPGRREYRP